MATAKLSVPAITLKNLLFATDFSEYSRHALPYVAALAKKFGSNIHLCHVVTPSQLLIGAPEAAPYLYEAERKTGAEELEMIKKAPELLGMTVRTILASGILEDELSTAITDNQIDMIVVGTHGRTGIRRLVLGSAAEAICRIAPCPVLTVGPDTDPKQPLGFRRILVPTDFSQHSLDILPYCLDLAREFGSTITFLNVIPTDAAVKANARELAEQAKQKLINTFAARCGPLKSQFLVDFGYTPEAILRAAKESKADLIAMGIKHAFTPGINLRSGVAYQVMAGARCPVLTCR